MTFRTLCPFLAIAAFTSFAWGAGPGHTGHDDPAAGALRTRDYPRGSCGQCHVERDEKGIKHEKGLWRENDNELCFTCHRDEKLSGIYPGQRIYMLTGHSTDPRFAWPGPTPPARREPAAAGKCLNCHAPHGRRDRDGLIPNLLVARDEGLCLTCHSGSPSSRDIGRDMRKPYSHKVFQGFGRHRSDEDGEPSRYSYTGGGRHVTCSDCHNAHAAFDDPLPPTPPTASNRNARVGRVRVANAGPGMVPFYEYRPANDASTPVLEYEICYKCHSSWTRQPPGQQDMARLFNTANASYHPVEAQGKNPGINPQAFAGRINAFSTIFCSDCHSSDDSSLRGPHGSQFPNILRKAYDAHSTNRVVTREELCFICHSFDVYANPVAAPLLLQASRFNPPPAPGVIPPVSRGGHAFHVGQQNIPCYACHDSHGSAQYPALIVTGRVPGLLGFSSSATGGSCQPTCHAPRSYTVNYAR